MQVQRQEPNESLFISALLPSNDSLIKRLPHGSAIWQKKDHADISQLHLNMMSAAIVQEKAHVSACLPHVTIKDLEPAGKYGPGHPRLPVRCVLKGKCVI